jgi:hypothetical protein
LHSCVQAAVSAGDHHAIDLSLMPPDELARNLFTPFLISDQLQPKRREPVAHLGRLLFPSPGVGIHDE